MQKEETLLQKKELLLEKFHSVGGNDKFWINLALDEFSKIIFYLFYCLQEGETLLQKKELQLLEKFLSIGGNNKLWINLALQT